MKVCIEAAGMRGWRFGSLVSAWGRGGGYMTPISSISNMRVEPPGMPGWDRRP